MAGKFFWADEIADNIIKQKGNKKEYVCASGIGVSGILHIGNFRDAITTDLVVRALKDKGKKVRFIYSWDDFDRFRKVPVGVPKEFEKYLGMPVSDIPSPFKKGESYTEYFEKEFIEELKKVGIDPEFISQSSMYKKCKYAKLIKKAIEKRKEIMKILNKYRKEALKKDWYPVTVYCEECKKDFTKILEAKDYVVWYECSCGHKGKIDFSKKGVIKAPWRVDWPMRWFYEKLDFEPGGADLGAAGGSMTTSDEIVKKIFNYEPPFHTYYEWIKIKGGKEFSGSSGNALTINDVLEVYEPEILRYLFVGTKPKTGFQISFDNDVIKIYEDYDDLEKRYYEKRVNAREKRIYEMCQLKLSKKKPDKESFRHLITLLQIGKVEAKDKKRAEKVRNWLDKYAEESMKFEVQTKVLVELNEKEKQAMIKLKNVLKNMKKPTEQKLFDSFYEICKDVGVTNTEFFRTAYRVILDKQRGPRLATLILAVGKNKIVKLLEDVK